MEDIWNRVDKIQPVFVLWWACNKANARAGALRIDLVMKRKVHKATNAKTWTLSKMPHQMNPGRDYIWHGIDVSKELDADFKFLKIHLVSHWVEQIRCD